MKIELDKDQVDAVTAARIAALEKEVKALERKLKNREEKIRRYQGGMDLTKERRMVIQQLARDLLVELDDALWAEWDREWA